MDHSQAVDVYLGFCYLIVVLALIEYAVVAYSNKKYDDRKKFKRKSVFEPKLQLETPDLLRDARIDECTCEQDVSILAIAMRPRSHRTCCRHNRIDLIARIVFPISFLAFNFVYWIVLISLSGWKMYGQSPEQQSC
ncbi:unnamed protein product [Gongylonema pulchrum]|uniref:Neur_chan_memb domain-containing protein n=1 Tax=Gongylonema pulchrum TaxID=637853 RepID=A0A3P7R8B4_9BILA|nr:unnamed protein product [Gongylonema pulchrum]